MKTSWKSAFAFFDMHPILVAEKEKYLQMGARHVFVVPYPYQNGHFYVFNGQGGKQARWLSDCAFMHAVEQFSSMDISVNNCRLYTYWLLCSAGYANHTPTQEERELIRLCLDANLPQLRAKAKQLIFTLYPAYKKSARNPAVLGACARYLASF